MKILFLTHYYPPDRQVGGQRARKVVEALRADGHDVVVIAAGRPAKARDANASLLRVRPMPSVRDYYARFRERYARPEAEGAADSTTVSASPSSDASKTPFWKRWIFSLIWLPDDKQGFVLPAVRKALHLPGGRPDLIYTTAPPFSAHLAGLVVNILTGIPWIAEFRDPWTTNPWKPADLRSAFSDWMERKLERICLDKASLLVAVSDGIARDLTNTGTDTPITTVRNGIAELRSPEEVAEVAASDGPFEIVYAGSFYHTRDPFPFLEAVKQVVGDRALGPADLRIRFIGTTDQYGGRSIRDHVRDTGLEDYVRLEGWMRPEQCQHHVQTADALLLLALDQPDQVPNKLYEYLGARRPILAIADEGGETARLLDRVGGHEILPLNDTALIRQALEHFLKAGRCGPVGNAAELAAWTTEAQMRILSEAVESYRPSGHTEHKNSIRET